MFRPILLSFTITILLLVANSPVLALTTNQCVPLPVGMVPDESSQGWTERTDTGPYAKIEVKTKNGELVIIGTRRFYTHNNGMTLGVYSYFGKIGFKAWSCDEDRDSVTAYTPDHMIAILQPDGSWFVKHAQSPDKLEVIFGADGYPKGVRIALHEVEVIIKK
ncbi:MAG: hypothetical protein HYW89_00195 [Candidatus Sungiibacteriota bacterium]|uniref:Uncharacterized protein n=1 Tax=Candidatus Sungiibacteriota bacterium TaxID=2750080 RepID=A0A7T5UPY2_9BACT|nr:MAG: hypothetical protein HYW89_00195 [Candidatus Sungbacteria bacterium]